MSRPPFALFAVVLAIVAQSACDVPTSPAGPCELSSGAFSSVPPAFVAVVTKVDYEHGIAPGGSELSNYIYELTIPSAGDSAAGVFVRRGTPIFVQTISGPIAVTACVIQVGSRVEISHDDAVSVSGGGGLPPETWYWATQLVIVH